MTTTMSIAVATSRRTTATLRMATTRTATRTHGTTTTRNKTATMLLLSRPSTKKMMTFSSSFSSSSTTSSKTSSSSSSFLGRLWNKYTEALIARPLLVKGGTASIIFFLSDTMTQRLLYSNSNTNDDDDDDDNTESDLFIWDYNRSLSGAGFGIVATCWLHYWWGLLEIVVNKKLPVCAINGTNKFINTLGKVFLDQVIGAPIYIYSYYCITHFGKEFSKMNQLKKNTNDNDNNNTSNNKGTTTSDNKTTTTELMKETSNRAIEMLPVTMIRHWTIWPAVHTLNFYYNPIHHRVLVQNLVLIFWSGYLSHLNNGGLVSTTNNNATTKTTKNNNNNDIPHLITPEDEIEMTEELILLQKKTTTTTTASLKQRRGSSEAAAAVAPLATSYERL